jgi:hypothetical protein
VLHLAVLPDDEDRARREAGQRTILDQDAVVLGERVVAKIGQGLDVRDAGRATPPLLGERQVHADCPDLHVATQLAGFLVEPTRLRVADRCVK